MPQIDLFYSPDISFDAKEVFNAIQTAISDHDAKAGVCKCRSYPAEQGHPSNLLLSIGLMQKPHRDKIYQQQLIHELRTRLEPYLKESTTLAINIYWLSNTYYSTP